MIELPRLKGLKSLPGITGLPGLDGRRTNQKAVEPLEPLLNDSLLLYDEKEADIARLVGSSKLAKKVMALMRQYPNGTLPELLVMDWLMEQQQEYIFQAPLGGGKTVKGGLVADFLVPVGAGWACWFIQGDYWHTQVGTVEKNIADKNMTLSQEYAGKEIELALELWEGKLYKQRDYVCQMALAGIEVGR